MGDDADTVAAIFGQIAGAYYGIDEIPTEWLDTLSFKVLIESYCNDIYSLSNGNSVSTDNLFLRDTFARMESHFNDIYRRFSPGPKMYSSVNVYDEDVKSFKNNFIEAEKQDLRVANLLLAYDKLFAKNRKTIEQRTSRPKLAFGFAPK